MCPNRVEALESRVQELEASVEGLTDELVECKVRLRELENAVDEDLGFTPSGPKKKSDTTTDEPAESGDTSKSQADDTSDSAEEQSEIIVA